MAWENDRPMPFEHGEVCAHGGLKRQCDVCRAEWDLACAVERIGDLDRELNYNEILHGITADDRDAMESRVDNIAVALGLSEREREWSNLNDVGERCVERAKDLERERDAEKDRRVYYQDIVYDACNKIKRGLGEDVVCGTIEEPSRKVQTALSKMAFYSRHHKLAGEALDRAGVDQERVIDCVPHQTQWCRIDWLAAERDALRARAEREAALALKALKRWEAAVERAQRAQRAEEALGKLRGYEAMGYVGDLVVLECHQCRAQTRISKADFLAGKWDAIIYGDASRQSAERGEASDG